MFHCRCRALTDRGEPIFFYAKDVPVCVDAEHFILANRPGLPLLRTATFSRAMDTVPLAEGDLVKIGGKEYTLVYHRGFCFRSSDHTYINSDAVSRHHLLERSKERPTKLQFKCRDTIFQLPAILGCVDGKAVIAGIGAGVDPEEIQISAGFTASKRKLFYGDEFNGGELIMKKGRPCVYENGTYIEAPSGRIFWGGEG